MKFELGPSLFALILFWFLTSSLCLGEAKAKFWSFLPLEDVKVPEEEITWSRKPIDRFVFRKMRTKNLSPSPKADKRTLIRRLSFDLIGLPPTSTQVKEFMEDDSEEAYERVLEEFLDSPHYGEKWGRHWLDLARYTDKTAKWLNSTASAWLYRDWVVDAFNRDLPYNQFVVMQLANDLLPDSDPKNNAALGFLGLSPTYWKELQLPPEIIKTTVADEWEERMDALGRTFLGLTLGCARCHDHKSDPLTQADYYGIAGVFASIRISDRPIMEEALWNEVTKARKKVASIEKEIAALKKKNTGEQSAPIGVKTPEFPKTYSIGVRQLKPTFHAPLNVVPENLEHEEGAKVSSDNFGTFKSGRMHGEVKTLGDSYALSFWFRNDLLNNTRPISAYLFSRGPEGSATTGDHFGIAGTYSKPNGVLFLFNGDKAGESLRGKTVLAPGTWNHVVLNRSGSRLSVFLNGKPEPEIEGEIKPTAKESKKIFIGGRSDKFSQLSGYIAHFTFFDRSIKADEILKLHAFSSQPKGPKTTPKETSNPILAKKNNLTEIEALTKQIESLKSNTPHYYMPMASGVTDSALHVNPRRNGSHGTTLDYSIGKARDLAIHKRGNPNEVGKIIPRRFLNLFPAKDGKVRHLKKGSGRLELAKAIVSEASPLSARVIVNRVWQHHFGQGLVATPSEMGKAGEPPTHPDLLNYLSGQFVKNGWSIKWLHREILLSETWKQGKRALESRNLDPNNKFLSGMDRRRLDFEAWRDSMLRVSDLLDTKRGGESRDLNSKDNNRRTIYGTIHRRDLNKMLSIHDFPDPTAHASVRTRTSTPLQQLFSLNGSFIRRQAEALAANLLKTSLETSKRIDLAYDKLFQRQPSSNEMNLASAFLDQGKDAKSAWIEYAHALLASNEFLFIE